LIKIKEEYSEQDKTQIQKIRVKMDRKREMMFDNYPIIVMSNDVEYSHYEVQKKEGSNSSSSPKNDENAKSVGLLDKAKEKALELKDSVVDTTKQLSNDKQKNE
jgi:hypothetical protein